MGKKKSVVLMTLLTIVIVVLCAITAFPSFTIPFTNGIKKWNPAVMQFDLGMDIGGEYLDSHVGGGYYAYYYPDGVVPANEYVEEDNDHDHDHGEEYGYEAHGGLYLSKDPDKRIYLEDGSKNPDFQEDFDAAVKAISARYLRRLCDSRGTSRVAGFGRFQRRRKRFAGNHDVCGHGRTFPSTGRHDDFRTHR